jgi:hypothetical protein
MQTRPQDHIDSKKNIVAVTLFESYLSRFILENTDFYKIIYIKILDALSDFIAKNRQNTSQQRFLSILFFELNRDFHGCDSFENLKKNFCLAAADLCIKKCADTYLKYTNTDVFKEPELNTLADCARHCLFSRPAEGTKILNKYLRHRQLFSSENRGALEEEDSGGTMTTQDLGIVDACFTPESLKDYFVKPMEPARFCYLPNEESYVAKWLRERHLPVIAGTSGSTELMLSRVIKLVSLSTDEIKMLLLAQCARMIAVGHHSFFECMLVSDRYGYRLKDTETLLDFYLQCIPQSMRDHDAFKKFLASEEGAALIKGMPLFHDEAQLKIKNEAAFVSF